MSRRVVARWLASGVFGTKSTSSSCFTNPAMGPSVCCCFRYACDCGFAALVCAWFCGFAILRICDAPHGAWSLALIARFGVAGYVIIGVPYTARWAAEENSGDGCGDDQNMLHVRIRMMSCWREPSCLPGIPFPNEHIPSQPHLHSQLSEPVVHDRFPWVLRHIAFENLICCTSFTTTE